MKIISTLLGYAKKILKWLSNSKLTEQPKEKKDPTDKRQLFQPIPIKETPFTAVRIEDGWILTMGKYTLNQTRFKTYDEVVEEAKSATWDRILTIMNICILNHEEMTQLNKTIADQQLKTKAGGENLESKMTKNGVPTKISQTI